MNTANERMLDDLEAVPSEDLVGRLVRFKLKPELTGHITCVKLFRAGRTLVVDYFVGDEPKAIDCDDYQIELVE